MFYPVILLLSCFDVRQRKRVDRTRTLTTDECCRTRHIFRLRKKQIKQSSDLFRVYCVVVFVSMGNKLRIQQWVGYDFECFSCARAILLQFTTPPCIRPTAFGIVYVSKTQTDKRYVQFCPKNDFFLIYYNLF